MRNLLNFIVKLVIAIIILAVALVPVWIFLAARYFLSPEGFWQQFATLGLGLVILGGIQIISLIVAIAAIVVLFQEPRRF